MSLGTRGDVQPFVALGSVLAGRGAQVTVSTGAGFEAMIEGAGLKAAPFSIDYQSLLQQPDIQAAMHSVSGKFRVLRQSRDWLRQELEEQWDLARTIRPDLIVYNPKAPMAPHVAHELRAAAVPALLQPVLAPTGEFPFMMMSSRSLGTVGNRLSHRLAAGLAHLLNRRNFKALSASRPDVSLSAGLDELAGYAPGGRTVPRLHAYSRHLVPRPDDWPDGETITGYWFRDNGEPDWTPPADLARFLQSGPPPVYVGFGSMPSIDARKTAHAAVEGLRLAGRRGVLATGWGGLDAEVAGDDMHVISGAPHAWLFPRCAAIVHHGGTGTTHQALRWGRPAVVCPIFGDQPFWARRVADAGAGSAPLPMKRFSAEKLAERLQEALSQEVRTQAEELGRLVRAESGAERAADVLELFMKG
ncbi:sterol 3beta-glucosyltransferase [Breoghania corrubedonensis]|uniref:Sterol 3beta-glucosyltransferase n=1 Tax=Breoghania corrubedonensis TaxID=665038 RepID=A0A2T5V8E0_9HYPH|nr:glycosyltransferase [Breoghania corrubedonensis]PTW60025.1 sterol 3beta-glucosyltransferase [Breoghania corrubedonensis]